MNPANFQIKITKSTFDSSVILYILYDDGELVTVYFRKFNNEYISNEILFSDLIAEYLIENNHVSIDNIQFNDFYKNLSRYNFKLTSTSLLQIL
jgi:hypothetical protein